MAMEILKFPRRYAILLLKGTVEGRIVWKTAALPYFLERDSGQDSVFGRDQTALKGVGDGGGAYEKMLRRPFQRDLLP